MPHAPLIVEDEPKTAALLGTALRQEGFEVAWAEDGIKGLEESIRGGFDLLLVDIMLPGLDGLGLVRELRARGHATPVIMLSARGEVEQRVEGLDAGADDYLPKPFAMSELMARVRSLFRRNSQQKAMVHSIGDLTFDKRPERRGAAASGSSCPPGRACSSNASSGRKAVWSAAGTSLVRFGNTISIRVPISSRSTFADSATRSTGKLPPPSSKPFVALVTPFAFSHDSATPHPALLLGHSQSIPGDRRVLELV